MDKRYSNHIAVKKGIYLHILNLQPELHREFFHDVEFPEEVDVSEYKTFPGFMKGIKASQEFCSNLLLFLPEKKFNPAKTRQIRLAKLDSPIYIIMKECSERDYLAYLALGASGILHPPFNHGEVQRVLNGHEFEKVSFPRNEDLIKEGQIRLDFLVPSKLSRILGVNRLVSFLTAEFGYPPEDCKVNLPMVMDEALSNAILHGNKGDEELKVHVRIYISSRRIIVQVEDQGEGFIPDRVSDPTGRENIYKDSGRGIYLIRELMDSVTFRNGGCIIEMEKRNRYYMK